MLITDSCLYVRVRVQLLQRYCKSTEASLQHWMVQCVVCTSGAAFTVGNKYFAKQLALASIVKLLVFPNLGVPATRKILWTARICPSVCHTYNVSCLHQLSDITEFLPSVRL